MPLVATGQGDSSCARRRRNDASVSGRSRNPDRKVEPDNLRSAALFPRPESARPVQSGQQDICPASQPAMRRPPPAVTNGSVFLRRRKHLMHGTCRWQGSLRSEECFSQPCPCDKPRRLNQWTAIVCDLGTGDCRSACGNWRAIMNGPWTRAPLCQDVVRVQSDDCDRN